jgi:hypothetical protein
MQSYVAFREPFACLPVPGVHQVVCILTYFVASSTVSREATLEVEPEKVEDRIMCPNTGKDTVHSVLQKGLTGTIVQSTPVRGLYSLMESVCAKGLNRDYRTHKLKVRR